MYFHSKREDYPVFPENYFSVQAQAILTEYRELLEQHKQRGDGLPEFPEHLLISMIDNTWHDTAEAVVENWVGKVYQLTSMDRKTPFMPGIDIRDPLNWLR